MAGPKKGVAFSFPMRLWSQADTDLVQTSVTLAAGDVQVSKDGGAFANIATLPTEIGTSGVLVVSLSADEMDVDHYTAVRFHDAAGDEWCDGGADVYPETGTISEIAGYTDDIGAAGAGLTALGDARLANLDAAISSRGTADPGDAMALTSGERTTLAGVIWNALLSGMALVGSVGKLIKDYLDAAISSRATPSDLQVSLAVSATEAATVATGSLAITLHGSFDQTIESDSDEDLDAADALIWAVKADRKRDGDAESLALVDVATGLRYLARAAYTGSAAHGSITLGGAAGAWEIRCQLAAAVTGELAEWAGRSLDAQVKAIFGSRTVNIWEGTARIGHQTIREV